MKKVATLLIGIVVALAYFVVGMTSPSPTKAELSPEDVGSSSVASSEAAISFGQVLSDAQVRQFLQQYNLKPTAIYMASAGQLGVHRVSPAKASAASVAEARQVTMEMLKASEKSSKERAGRYLDKNPKERILAEPDVAKEARSMVGAIQQDQQLRENINAGQPIIYGVDVLGDPQSLQSALQDSMVKEYELAVEVNGKVVIPQIAVPEGLQASPPNAGTEHLSPSEVYEQLERQAGRSK